MSKIDDLINETLSEEDEALLQTYDNEPGYFSQAFSLFTGRLGWVMWLVGIIQLAFFVLALYALYKAFTVDVVLSTVRWGIGAIVLVQLSVFLRGFMGMHFEANRVLRGVKRLELRLARAESGKD